MLVDFTHAQTLYLSLS